MNPKEKNKNSSSLTLVIKNSLLLLLFLGFSVSFLNLFSNPQKILWLASLLPAAKAETENLLDDFELYEKYQLYLDWQKKEKYEEYKKYAKAKKKYGFKNSAEKASHKEAYEKYKLYLKNPTQYRAYSILHDQYKKYKNYKRKVVPLKKYSFYKKYEKYDDKKYNEGKNYGGEEYKAGYDRYRAALKEALVTQGEADLGCGVKNEDICYGPEITVGLWAYTKNEMRDGAFKIQANKNYMIKNKNGEIVVSEILADTQTKVKYLSNQNMRVYDYAPGAELTLDSEVYFEAADGNNFDLIFDVNKPATDFDKYRGKMKLYFYDSPEADGDRIWVINTLPLEQYIWGMGEMTGTGHKNHNRVMTTAFRTYGYWKIKFSTRHAAQGFKVTATSSSQIYYGYNWETRYPRIREAAQETQGKIVMYLRGGTNEIALTPYSSWSDGRTRSFEERWGSKDYPWCQSVSDPYGKHPSKKTSQLENEGNHMVGLIANGSLNLATNHEKDWEWILKYYFKNINILKAY